MAGELDRDLTSAVPVGLPFWRLELANGSIVPLFAERSATDSRPKNGSISSALAASEWADAAPK